MKKVLVIGVAFNSDDYSTAFIKAAARTRQQANVQVVVVENSEHEPVQLRHAAEESPDVVSVEWMPENPGYFGAARRVLSNRVASDGPLSFDAVVVCNVDVQLDFDRLVQGVDEALEEFGDAVVIAPRITEGEHQRELNPHVLTRWKTSRRLAFGLARSVPLLFTAIEWIHQRRQHRVPNQPRVEPSGTLMYSPHGSFMIFGRGFFTSGGAIPEAPLYDEEYAVGEIAQMIGIPVRFFPGIEILHVGAVSTSRIPSPAKRHLLRRTALFYAGWQPEFSRDSMSQWFLRG